MAVIGSFLALLHAWAATAGAVAAGLLVLLGALDGAGAIRARPWLDRLALALLAAMVVSALLGPGIVIGVRPPSDATHYLFAAIALATVPVLRFAAVRRGSARAGWWVAGGGAVTLVALVRLWATGG
jgi:hypothetical protein